MHNPRGCWRECIAAALALFCAVGLNVNAFSVYVPYLTELLQLSYAQSSNFIVVRNLFAFGAIFLVKFYYDKLEIRLGYTLTLIMVVLAFILYVSAQSFMMLCIAAAISGLAAGLGGMYPVSILIHRWFPHHHEGLATGICAASTGIAIIIGSPILTWLIENFSIQTAMIGEIVFLMVITVLCFELLRNFPSGVLHHKIQHHAKRQPLRISWMFWAATAIGALGGCFSFLTLHYTTEGFDPYQVSTIVSLVGLILMIGKFIMGELLDLWGAVRTNWLYLSMAFLGCLLFSFGGSIGYVPVLIAACLYGFGDSVPTVGLAIYAKDLSTPETFSATQQQYQMAYQLGTLAASFLPGLVSTVTHNYRLYYVFVTVMVVFTIVVVQREYAKAHRLAVEEVQE